MADISVADIKRVREITGAGMSDVKKALVEADGDQDKAIEELRKKGAAKAVKRGADRVASNGLVVAADGGLLELACETDFVAKNEQFQQLATTLVEKAVAAGVDDTESLLALEVDGKTVQDLVNEQAGSLGEKLEVRRYTRFAGKTATYLHKRSSDLPAQIGVTVEYEGDDAEAARGAAMQVASLGAQYLTREDVPAEAVEKERAIAEEIAKQEGKPEAALARIVEGRVQGFYQEVVLLEQKSVRDNKQTVKKALDQAGVTITRFARFEVGKA